MRNFRLSLALPLVAIAAAGAYAQVRYEDILQGPADNWLTYAGDYQGRRHSALKQITVENAASLAPWTEYPQTQRFLRLYWHLKWRGCAPGGKPVLKNKRQSSYYWRGACLLPIYP